MSTGTGSTRWERLDLGTLTERLAEVQRLLAQAAALAAAQDTARLSAMTEVENRSAEEGRGDPHRRRYR
jgi:hypothetical protein